MVKDGLNGALLALRRLRGQAGLLAVLMALAVLLSAGTGILLEQLFADHSGFTGMTIAVCGAEGEDDLTRRLVSAAALAADVDDYCTIRAVTEEEGRAALEEGRVSALLILPEGFLDSVLTGENKPVTLLTDGQQPLESWLIGELGQSVSRMLAAAQAGIYTVLEEYDRAGLEEPAREDLIWEVNLAYIGWVADRNDVYETITVSPTGSDLPAAEHYALTVLAYLPLLCSALVYPAFGGGELTG
ncbi:MAG: ABC transporter permease, partial [Oscillospiraceae bacterium]|nr:ABC transporter permease [Oscillospiraceae bacterium]